MSIERLTDYYSVVYLKKYSFKKDVSIGRFVLPEQRWYAQKGVSSGHFNWADLSLCYNQLAFVSLVTMGYGGDTPLYGLIGQISARFYNEVTDREFEGRIYFEKDSAMSGKHFFFTSFNFADAVKGKVTISIPKQI